MRLALITIAFLLHSQIPAAASTRIAPEAPAKNFKTVKPVKAVHQAGATATHMKLQPGQEAVRAVAGNDAPQIVRQADARTPPANSAQETEDLSYGTLLAALMLMAAIAVRRLKAGRP